MSPARYHHAAAMRTSIVRLVVLFLCFGGVAAAGQQEPVPSPLSVAVDGVLFATVDWQGGLRGDTAVTSQNWLMAMGMRRVGSGMLTLNAMVSAEPLTVGAAGYPQLFQVGEAYRGQLTDRQHPHDLFLQLSAGWRQPLVRTALTSPSSWSPAISAAPAGRCRGSAKPAGLERQQPTRPQPVSKLWRSAS